MPFPIKLAVAKLGVAFGSPTGLWALAWRQLLERENPWVSPSRRTPGGHPDDLCGEVMHFLYSFYSFVCDASEASGKGLRTKQRVKQLASSFQDVVLLNSVEPGFHAYSSQSRILRAYYSLRKGRVLPPVARSVVRAADIPIRTGEVELTECQVSNNSKLIADLGLRCLNGNRLPKSDNIPPDILYRLSARPEDLPIGELLETLYWWLLPSVVEGFSLLNGSSVNHLARKLVQKVGLPRVEVSDLETLLRGWHAAVAAEFAEYMHISIDAAGGLFMTELNGQVVADGSSVGMREAKARLIQALEARMLSEVQQLRKGTVKAG